MSDVIPNNSPRLRPHALSLDRSGGAVQADAAGTNINSIVAQYKKNGTLPNVNQQNPLYGDYTFPEDLHEMREAVYEAEQRFKQFPADVRSLCGNDWVQFVDQFDNPEQREELINAGLKINSPPQQPVKTDNESDKTPTPQTDQQSTTDTPTNQAVGGSGGLPPIVPADKGLS